MIFGIISIVLELAIIFFAVLGVQGTIARYRHTHGMAIVRDLLKYLVLFISVLITCFGLSGLLGQLMDSQNVNSHFSERCEEPRLLFRGSRNYRH